MSQLVKTKLQANFKDFKRFGAFKGLVEQKTLYSIRSCVNWAIFGTRGPLKRSFLSRFKMVHLCKKGPNLHTNSLNKLLLFARKSVVSFISGTYLVHIIDSNSVMKKYVIQQPK
jgi:hypothetical protein